MTLFKAINYSFSYLGQTFQEVKDIYANGYVVYHYGSLEKLRNEDLTPEECLKIRVLFDTYRSGLFVLQNYSFQITKLLHNYLRIKAFPIKEHPSSLASIFFQKSLFRIAKGISILALSILVFPIGALVLTGAYIYDSKVVSEKVITGWLTGKNHAYLASGQQKISLPPEPIDSHFTSKDITKIGRALIGYRHVSTEELAQNNTQKGIPDGCSLNISFCSSETDDRTFFENLDLKIINGENCDVLIKQYEDAITQFIFNSIGMDLYDTPRTYATLFASINKTRFMLVKTGWFKAADAPGYWGMGRFAKEKINPEGVILLPRIKKAELGISDTQHRQLITSPFECNTLMLYLTSHYRKKLLSYFRENFNPNQFKFLIDFSSRYHDTA